MSTSVAQRVPGIMNVLRDGFVAIAKENYEEAWYYPWSKLNLLFNESNVKEAINESEIEPYQRDEAVQSILRGGKRVFATLVQMNSTPSIVKFMERDHLQHQPLDARLPYPKSELVSILGKTDGALFYHNQWEVSAPIFHADLSHRSFDRPVVLPFILNKRIGSGAYGDVYETMIDPEHQLDAAGANLSSVRSFSYT
jgi:hypothetical protein